MNQAPAGDVKSIFKQAGAILEGHFLLTSGLHSPVYWEKFRILEQPQHAQRLCGMIAAHFKNSSIDVVAGPTTGGIILAFEVARQMGLRCIFAEKEGERRVFRRGFVLNAGERVLVVDDILTTGKSVREVLGAVGERGAVLAGIGVLVDRSDRDPGFGYPVMSCLRSVTPAYEPAECPLCLQGLPLVKPGSSGQPAV
jgi:orotate phosphoribosyltransferase